MKRCDYCGFSFDDIIRNKSIGCPYCYNTFRDEFIVSLKSLNITFNPTEEKEEDVISRVVLKKQMEKAVKDENYEKAAIFRDYLKALDNGRTL